MYFFISIESSYYSMYESIKLEKSSKSECFIISYFIYSDIL